MAYECLNQLPTFGLVYFLYRYDIVNQSLITKWNKQMAFSYPVGSVNKDNYVIVNQSGEDVIRVPIAPIYTHFYFLHLGVNSPSPLKVIRVPVDYIMSGMLPLQSGGYSFIRLPAEFLVDPLFPNTTEPVAARWHIGDLTGSLNAVIPDRATEYLTRLSAEEENLDDSGLLGRVTQYEAIAATWSTTLNALLVTEYP